tara:strand:- start:7688 stop:8335 length:648 start_codon:yes stop_codon:yes gene_type:complete
LSLINIFTAKSPTLNGIEFDAVLEDTFEASVELTGYEIELGARASDHRIIKPMKWSIIGAVSNTPLQPGITDFVGGVLSNFTDSGVASTVAGLSAGFLAGSTETRSSAALEELLTLMTTGEPFDVDAGDKQLVNMVIGNIRRTKDASNEGGLIFEAELQEYPTLKTTITNNQPISSQLNQDDPSASQASALNNIGELIGSIPSAATALLVGGVLG